MRSLFRNGSLAAMFALVVCCSPGGGARAEPPGEAKGTAPAAAVSKGQAVAVLAGGCFWCMEKPFESLPGVISATSGYTGGSVYAPSYQQVSSGNTGHFEAIRILYDPARIGYERLLDVFLHNIDPTQGDGQFCDRGPQYRSAIFVHDEEQRQKAKAALARAERALGKKVVTKILDEGVFFVAEDYHQDFNQTHASRYQAYRLSCGRDERLEELWGKTAGH